MKWDKWRFDLDSKFAVLFLTEKGKWDYIRDHCKAIAFDVLEARADPLSEDPYITIKEMVSELSRMFGDYDKLAKCSATLHDPAFAMKTKAFDDFYTRSAATITPRRYTESHKIAASRRLASTKLQLRLADGPGPPAIGSLHGRGGDRFGRQAYDHRSRSSIQSSPRPNGRRTDDVSGALAVPVGRIGPRHADRLHHGRLKLPGKEAAKEKAVEKE